MHNFNDIDTVYERNLVTVCLKRRPEFVADPEDEPKVGSPNDIYELLNVIYSQLSDDQEHLIMLVMSISNAVSGFKVISSGTQSMGPADAKTVFRNALMLGAAKIVLAHNHPSGTLKPSQHDIDFTNKMIEVGKLMDLQLLDHVIYTHAGYFSMRGEGVCEFEPAV